MAPTPSGEPPRLHPEWLLGDDPAAEGRVRSDPRDLERVKREHSRRLSLLYVPLLRLVAFGLLGGLLLPLHNLMIDDSRSPTTWVPVALGLVAYPFATWIWAFWLGERVGRLSLTTLTSGLDFTMIALAIYFTGADRSAIFFLPLVRVAEQAHFSLRGALLRAHLAPLTYLAVIGWVAGVDGLAVSWQVEIAKLVVLYAVGIYVALTAMTAEVRHRWVTGALRSARGAIQELERESRRLVLSREELKDQAIRDPLTGLLNRKGILDIVERGLERSRTGEVPFSLVLADLDNFKQVNDERGHPIGDVVLRRVASRMLASGRAFDAVGRIGGDEFLIALPNCDESGASRMAERIRLAVIEPGLLEDLEIAVAVGVSLGIATAEVGGEVSSVELIDLADRALYRAKERGGNCVELARAAAWGGRRAGA